MAGERWLVLGAPWLGDVDLLGYPRSPEPLRLCHSEGAHIRCDARSGGTAEAPPQREVPQAPAPCVTRDVQEQVREAVELVVRGEESLEGQLMDDSGGRGPSTTRQATDDVLASRWNSTLHSTRWTSSKGHATATP